MLPAMWGQLRHGLYFPWICWACGRVQCHGERLQSVGSYRLRGPCVACHQTRHWFNRLQSSLLMFIHVYSTPAYAITYSSCLCTRSTPATHAGAVIAPLACCVFCFTGCPVAMQHALHAQIPCNECGWCSGNAFFSGLCGPVTGSAFRALHMKAACLRVPGCSTVLPNSTTSSISNARHAFAVRVATIVAICNNMHVCGCACAGVSAGSCVKLLALAVCVDQSQIPCIALTASRATLTCLLTSGCPSFACRPN